MPVKPTAACWKWQVLLSQEQVAPQTAESGLTIVLDRGVTLEIACANDDSSAPQAATVRVRARDVGFLFADGATEDDQAAWLAAETDPPSTVLVTPRQPTQAFVSATGPMYAVFCAGGRTRTAPSADAIATLAPATIFNTDENGAIEMIVKDERLSLSKGSLKNCLSLFWPGTMKTLEKCTHPLWMIDQSHPRRRRRRRLERVVGRPIHPLMPSHCC